MIGIPETTTYSFETRVGNEVRTWSGTTMTYMTAAENAACAATGRSEIEEAYLLERQGHWRIYLVRFDAATFERVAVCQID